MYSRDASPQQFPRRERTSGVGVSDLVDAFGRSRNAILPKHLVMPSADISDKNEVSDPRLFKFEMSKFPTAKPNQGGNNIELFQRLRPNYVRQGEEGRDFAAETTNQVTGRLLIQPRHRTYRYVGNTLEDLLRPGTTKLRDQDKFLGHLYKFLSLSEIWVLHALLPRSENVIKIKHHPFDDPFSISRCYDVGITSNSGSYPRRLSLFPEKDHRRAPELEARVHAGFSCLPTVASEQLHDRG